jgi:predicted acylesterase/phospholipase RssA
MSEAEKQRVHKIGVCLSGGGHRASLFGLGALLYLAHAKAKVGESLSASVQAICSVSGGSITNAFLAQSLDFQTATTDQVNGVAAVLATQIAKRGTLFAHWGTWIYVSVLSALGAVVLLALAPITATFIFGQHNWGPPIALLTLALLAATLQARSRICEWAFAKTLFSDTSGRPTRLKHLTRQVAHVLCATEVQTGQPVWFTSRGVFCEGFELTGDESDLYVARAVQASAALPVAFSPRRIRAGLSSALERAWPAGRRKPKRMVVVDGGVRDNLGVDVLLQWTDDPWSRSQPGERLPHIEDLIVVSGAANRIPRYTLRSDIPFFGELFALKKVSELPYNTREANTRRALEWRFRASIDLERAGWPHMRGTLLHIEESPTELAEEINLWIEDWRWQSTPPQERDPLAHPYGRARRLEALLGLEPPKARWIALLMGWSERRETAYRAKCVIEALGRAEGLTEPTQIAKLWRARAEDNAAIGTHLSRLPGNAAARLMQHGFALAMARLNILWNYPMVEVPSLDFFERLAGHER